MKEILVKTHQDKLRLDVFLTGHIRKSRSQIKKDIENGLVLVNGEKAKVHQFLNQDDVIQVNQPAHNATQGVAGGKNIKTKQSLKEKILNIFNKADQPKIIQKQKDYLIIEKPAGLLVHPTNKNEDYTLINWLLKKFPELEKVGDPVSLLNENDQTFRPSIVHRLDRDVSGLMVIPRNQEMFDHLKSQFKLRKVYKGYIALVHGQLPKDEDIIDFEISRSSASGRMAAHPEGSGKGKRSATQYKVLQRFDKYTLIEARPLTGRTNQIRVHFFALGHPIAGDKLYCIKSFKEKFKLNRVFLHASKLQFEDKNKNTIEFDSALPEELKKIIDQLT